MRAIATEDTVEVGGDSFKVLLILTQPEDPSTERDMQIIKAEIERLLPAWIKSKIQAGEP